MALKLVDQEEAAKMLGVSVEEINKMRDRKQLFPYRDGDAWKFKLDDIERAKQELAAGAGDSWAQGGDFGLAPPEPDSVLLSEKELGQSADSTSSTIIGKGSPHGPVTEGDIQLAGSTKERDASLSDVGLAADISGIGSDVRLVVSGSDAKKKADASQSGLGALDDLQLEPSGSQKGGSQKGGSDSGAGSKSGSSSIKLRRRRNPIGRILGPRGLIQQEERLRFEKSRTVRFHKKPGTRRRRARHQAGQRHHPRRDRQRDSPDRPQG